MANIDANEHSLLRNFIAEGHAPEVTSEFRVHLANNVKEDSVIVLHDGAIGDELRDDGAVTIDLVLEERVEVLVVRVVWHDHQEDEVRVLDRFHTIAINRGVDGRNHFPVIVVLDARCKSFQKILIMDSGTIRHWADICVLDCDS